MVSLNDSTEDLQHLGRMSVGTPELETYPWSDSQRQIIQAHYQYHVDMINILETLQEEEPESVTLPKVVLLHLFLQ